MSESMETRRKYDSAGFGDLIGYGDAPTLIVVDLQRGFTDPESPLGIDSTDIIAETNRLLDAAHRSGVPVVFTRIVSRHPDLADLGVWAKKLSKAGILTEGSEMIELDKRLETTDRDYILEKKQASAFHETELDSMLTASGRDTVVVAGLTTSGCVRATVVDACSHGFRAIVPEEGVGDRAPEPHEANLFDMQEKYADVRPVGEVVDYLSPD